jgi:hypothetical protein
LPVVTANKLWNGVAPDLEEETMLPFLLGAFEVEAVPPEKRDEVERKANRRAMRILNEGIRPSANGSIGRKLAEVRRMLHEESERPTKRGKKKRVG